MERQPIIIDCDPGHDDAMAILWALAFPQLELKAVTTVAGNTSIDKVTNNAIKVLTKARRENIPVVMGAAEPLVRSLLEGKTGLLFHGASGLDGPFLPENGFAPYPGHAVNFLIELIEKSEEKITIIATGPLTNIALLLKMRPDLKCKIALISLMGGGARRGNWTPVAEYNIYADVEAAYIVFHSGIKILMAGLDVTQKAYITRQENELLRAKGTELACFVAELIDFFSKSHYEIENFPGCTLHDPTAVAAVVHPEWFTIQTCYVDIEMDGALTKGMTVVDDMNYLEKLQGKVMEKNVSVIFDLDREMYIHNFIELISKL